MRPSSIWWTPSLRRRRQHSAACETATSHIHAVVTDQQHQPQHQSLLPTQQQQQLAALHQLQRTATSSIQHQATSRDWVGAAAQEQHGGATADLILQCFWRLPRLQLRGHEHHSDLLSFLSGRLPGSFCEYLLWLVSKLQPLGCANGVSSMAYA